MPRKYGLKRYRPKPRKLKIVRTINSINSKVFLILFLLFSFSFISFFAVSRFSKVKLSSTMIFSNIIQSITVKVGDANIEKRILDIASLYKSYVFDENLKNEISNKILQTFPFLDNPDISFNKINGMLKIDAVIRKSIGRILNGESTIYLLEDSGFSKESYNNENLLEINARTEHLDKSKFKIIKDLYLNRDRIPFDFKIKVEKDKIYVFNENYEILWGDESFFNEKIDRLKYILNDATKKLDLPLYIDMRFFNEGKVIVSSRKTNLLK